MRADPFQSAKTVFYSRRCGSLSHAVIDIEYNMIACQKRKRMEGCSFFVMRDPATAVDVDHDREKRAVFARTKYIQLQFAALNHSIRIVWKNLILPGYFDDSCEWIVRVRGLRRSTGCKKQAE